MSKKPKMVICKNCNTPIAKKAKICPSCGVKNKKSFYKQWWFILLIIFIVILMIASKGEKQKETSAAKEEEMGTLNWPKSEIAALLPVPKSSVGEVFSESSDWCFIYVGKMSQDDFNAYIDECAEKGFVVDYERGDKFYYADDENGNHISLTYDGDNVMTVEIRRADDVEEESEGNDKEETNKELTETESDEMEPDKTEPDETEDSGNNTEPADDLRPEFKNAMDSYEEVMIDYCDFMKKYSESDGTNLELLSDYADYMSKYAKAIKAFEAWESEELNTAEMAYYLDVQNRINKKLLEITQ